MADIYDISIGQFMYPIAIMQGSGGCTMFCFVKYNCHLMQDLEYLIRILKFCEKELTKVVPGGVVGAALWIVCIGMYKNNTICKNYCFSNNTSSYVLRWQVGGYSPLAPLNLPLHTLHSCLFCRCIALR